MHTHAHRTVLSTITALCAAAALMTSRSAVEAGQTAPASAAPMQWYKGTRCAAHRWR
jgi:hypothetical protein